MAAQTPQNSAQYLQVECEAMSWPQRTDGQKGTMVKTRTETYVPRFLVGASSEVTASAVNSLIPAPIPEIAIPPEKGISPFSIRTFVPQLTDEGVHLMSGATNNHANNEEDASSEGNVSTTHKIGKRADKGTDACQGEQVG